MAESIPDSKIQDTQEEFENLSQTNAQERSDSQTAWEVNRKRTYDVYQSFDVESFRQSQRLSEKLDNIAVQALQNSVETSNMVAKQAIKHADVAADALWTDELNPVTRGAGNDLTGQAPVNPALASTASLDTVYTNITAQTAELVTGFVTMAQALAQSNANISQSQSAIVAALAEVVAQLKASGKSA